MKKYVIALTVLLASPGMMNSQTTQRFTANKANDHTLTYTLPNTMLEITIETEKRVKKPGEFVQYASKYLKGNDAILNPSEKVTVKSVTIASRGESNSEERYSIKFPAGNAPFMIFNDQNLPLAINTDKIYTPKEITLPVAQAAKPTILETPAAKQAISQEMQQSTSLAKRAELAAELIYTIRENRNEVISGQSEQSFADGKALQLALDNLNAQEAALTAMFLGTEQVSTSVATVDYMPDADVTNFVLARVSSDGVVAADDLSGEPVYLNLTITEEGEMPVDNKGVQIPFPKNGFAYRIPGKALVSISFDNKEIYAQTFDIAQFGITYGLAPNLFTHKKEPMYLIFDPTTGAYRELGPVEPATLEAKEE